MAGPIDVKWKESKLIASWSHNVTFTFDHIHGIDHEYSWLNFEITVYQK